MEIKDSGGKNLTAILTLGPTEAGGPNDIIVAAKTHNTLTPEQREDLFFSLQTAMDEWWMKLGGQQ